MSDFLTQAEYSRLHGVSRKTVTHWKQEGILVMKGNLVDRAASDASLERNGRGGVTQRSVGNKSGNTKGEATSNNPASMKPVPTVAVNSVRETLRDNGQPSGPGNMTFMQAKTADMVLRAQLRKLELEDRKNSLINREKTYSHINGNARQFRDSVLNWPSRVSAEMAAELGVDGHRLQITLEKYLRDLLEELSEMRIRLE